MKHLFVRDIALASILDAFGVPKRQPDCVTIEDREYQGKPSRSAKWWFDVSDQENADKAKWVMEAYDEAREWDGFDEHVNDPEEWIKHHKLPREHPLYWMKGVLENRTANLHLYHYGATPMRVIESGSRTVFMGPRISQKDKEILKSQT